MLRLDAHLVVSTLVPHRLDDVQADEGLGLDALLDLLARLLGGEVCGFLETTREGKEGGSVERDEPRAFDAIRERLGTAIGRGGANTHVEVLANLGAGDRKSVV